MMEDIQVCSNWEDIADNSTILEQQLEKLRMDKTKREEPKIRILTRNKADTGRSLEKTKEVKEPIVLDPAREENLRSQYVPPEPKIKLLARPKSNAHAASASSTNGAKSKSKSQPKTLEQREKEYKEARMRILGDVQFSDPEEEHNGLSPAEVLKQKILEVNSE